MLCISTSKQVLNMPLPVPNSNFGVLTYFLMPKKTEKDTFNQHPFAG